MGNANCPPPKCHLFGEGEGKEAVWGNEVYNVKLFTHHGKAGIIIAPPQSCPCLHHPGMHGSKLSLPSSSSQPLSQNAHAMTHAKPGTNKWKSREVVLQVGGEEEMEEAKAKAKGKGKGKWQS